MWLFNRDTSEPLKYKGKDVLLSNGQVAEWDPDFPLGLAVVVPSGVEVPDEDNMYAFNIHFSGNHNLLKEFNVIYHHGNHHATSRTDKRIKARCYFRVRGRAAPAPTADAEGQSFATVSPTCVMKTHWL